MYKFETLAMLAVTVLSSIGSGIVFLATSVVSENTLVPISVVILVMGVIAAGIWKISSKFALLDKKDVEIAAQLEAYKDHTKFRDTKMDQLIEQNQSMIEFFKIEMERNEKKDAKQEEANKRLHERIDDLYKASEKT